MLDSLINWGLSTQLGCKCLRCLVNLLGPSSWSNTLFYPVDKNHNTLRSVLMEMSYKLDDAGEPVCSCYPVQTFLGGRTCKLLTKNALFQNPEKSGSILVCIGDEASYSALVSLLYFYREMYKAKSQSSPSWLYTSAYVWVSMYVCLVYISCKSHFTTAFCGLLFLTSCLGSFHFNICRLTSFFLHKLKCSLGCTLNLNLKKKHCWNPYKIMIQASTISIDERLLGNFIMGGGVGLLPPEHIDQP